jgi:hypothetical protein
MAVSTIADMAGMIAAAQPGAKVISTANVSANEASPTSMTIDEARLKLREKNILTINPLPLSGEADYYLACFFCS